MQSCTSPRQLTPAAPQATAPTAPSPPVNDDEEARSCIFSGARLSTTKRSCHHSPTAPPSRLTNNMGEPDNHMDIEVGNVDASMEMDAELSQPSQEFYSESQPSQTSQAGSAAPSETENDVIDVEKEPAKGKGRKEMQPRSEWWNHFIQIKDDNDVVQAAKCKYCQRQVKAESKRDGTSALKRHFVVCKRNPHKFNKDPKQGTIQATHGEGVGTWKFDAEALKVAFVEMIIEDELPFAFDCWTSQQQDGYMTMTASFIDNNWEMHRKVINFFLIKGHKGDDIGKNLMRCLGEWGMESVMTVTVDNAANNDNGIGYLRKQLNKTPSNIASGKYLHMRCAAHIVNLIVQDGLKEVDTSLKRIRAAVRYIRNGGTRLVKFREIVVEEKVDSKKFLKIDVPTRWNSTYLMLKAANVYDKVFTKLAKEDLTYKWDLSEENGGFGCPEEDDFENTKKMEEFLGHFYDLTTRVSSTLHVTSNTFFHEIAEVHLLIKTWLDSEDNLQEAMGRRMKEKFDKYWGLWHINDKESTNEKGKGKAKEKENINLLIFVAAAVDPRYKLSLYTNAVIEEIFGQEKGQLVWTAINTCINELFVEYTKMYAPIELTYEVDDSRVSKGARGGMLKEVIAKKLKMTNGANSNAKSELDKYLAEDTEDHEMKFDILAWWRANACRFPILACLARDVLAIPISTVGSESAFSTSGRILDDFRTSLTPFMLEALVCAQDWLRRGTPIDIQESLEELVVIEKELIEEFGGKHIAKGQGALTKASTSKTTKSTANSSAGTSS